jgi:uncharacterized Zn-finger protein
VSSSTSSPALTGASVVTVSAKDLHGPGVVFCPNPKMALWSNHPKVYIDVSSGEGRCAYCGTVYRLAPGTQLSGHH